MRLRLHGFRKLVGALVALAFVVAVQPGAMAMPAAPHTVSASGINQMSCDHMQHMKTVPHKPNIGTTICPGMLSCAGVSILSVNDCFFVSETIVEEPVPHADEAVPSLTLQPDNPPPIA